VSLGIGVSVGVKVTVKVGFGVLVGVAVGSDWRETSEVLPQASMPAIMAIAATKITIRFLIRFISPLDFFTRQTYIVVR
jgi:hypothetical protein